jgi:hypothetical protein
MKGAGVPRPVQPKSHTQRNATANPITDGMAASHRQRAAPAVSTRNPSHPGSNQNHNAKNDAPTASANAALGHAFDRVLCGVLSACAFMCGPPCETITTYYSRRALQISEEFT